MEKIILIIIASLTVAALNRSRGAGTIHRAFFSFGSSLILTQGVLIPTVIMGLLILLAWTPGWGKYIGAIHHHLVPDEKEEPITDFLMNPLMGLIGEKAWGTLATSVRFYIYLIPFYFYVFAPWGKLIDQEWNQFNFYWLIPSVLSLMAGPCYLLGYLYEEWIWKKNEDVIDGWALGEWFVGFWIAASSLIVQNYFVI